LSFSRLIVFVVGLAFVAVFVPKVGPRLLAGIFAAPAPSAASLGERSADGRQIALRADPHGHFIVEAIVNGRQIEMMVDTGATIVALTADTAHRLGIDPAESDYKAPLSTANGIVAAAPLSLAEIRVGGIAIHDVEAAIVPGQALPVNLLGMSFLKRLSKFELAGGQLLLVE
jgi:aspartyl protease family protein